MVDRTWPRRVLAEVLTGAAAELRGLATPPRTLWRVQVDGMAQASATMQVALAARLAGCSWLGIARTLNAHGLRRFVNPAAGTFEDWDQGSVARATLSVAREPGMAHVLGWFAREFTQGDLLEAVWIISAMDSQVRHTSASAFSDAVAAPGLERALAVARAAAAPRDGAVAPRPAHRLDGLGRNVALDAAEVARACWYFLFGPGARGKLGFQRVVQDAFRQVAADALEMAGAEALEDALMEREREQDAAEREARAEAVRAARAADRGKR